jgi:hypothetical protein
MQAVSSELLVPTNQTMQQHMPEASKLNTHHDEKSNGVHFFLYTNYMPRGSQEEAGNITVMGQNTHIHTGWGRQYFVRSDFHTRFIFP